MPNELLSNILLIKLRDLLVGIIAVLLILSRISLEQLVEEDQKLNSATDCIFQEWMFQICLNWLDWFCFIN